MADYFAHSAPDGGEERWQTLPDHLEGTSDLAGRLASAFGAERAARLAGLYHDLGKYNPEFLAYLRQSQSGVAGKARGPDHATAGAAVLLRAGGAARPEDRVLLELLAHAIAGHHGGMPDRTRGLEVGATRSLDERVEEWSPASLDPVWQAQIAGQLTGLLPPGFRFDARKAPASLANPVAAKAFQLAFLGRMLFSCLVDADFRDTERFYAACEGRAVDRDWPRLPALLDDLRARFDAHMAGLAEKAKTGEGGTVNRLRGEILAHVRGRAGEAPGVFTLNVPTGGGKTLASLGFALDHAARHGQRRIIYAIPFTSIIEQTAEIFRKVLGEDVVLEHHSAIETPQASGAERRDKLKLAMENWEAPVVVTTTVQLFDSLFANRPGRCRKLHNIAGSILILDEAQTLPLKVLKPVVLALDELARNYGCTIVLCTATQPALERGGFPPDSLMGLETAGRELAPDPAALACALKRTGLAHGGTLDDAALVGALGEASRALVIVNSRRHALDLYRAAKAEGLEGLVHLSTRQCAVHRQALLREIRERLSREEPCRVVSTSLIEAGVDIDFPRVLRAEAGLDQVLQAAGRCNREGSRSVEESLVSVFRPADHAPPPELKQFAEAFAEIARTHEDLFSPEAVAAYFAQVYWQRGEGLDHHGILKLAAFDRTGTTIAYRRMAELFSVIESAEMPVVIPHDEEARGWIGKLGVEGIGSGAIARGLQRHLVLVPARVRAELIANGHAAYRCPELRGEQFVVLNEGSRLYDRDVGLLWEERDRLGFESI